MSRFGSTVATPIVDKNGKQTTVHKSAGPKVGTNRLSGLGATSSNVDISPIPTKPPTVSISPSGRSVRIDGVAYQGRFSYVNRRSRNRRQVTVHPFKGKFRLSAFGANFHGKTVDAEELKNIIELTWGGEYSAVMEFRAKVSEENARVEAEEAAQHEEAIADRFASLAGTTREEFDQYISKIKSDAEESGYERGRSEGYDDGYAEGARNASFNYES